jgi:hypothetical protein
MDADTNKTKSPGKYPIGYWAREADKLLTEAINQIHSAFGINRTQWQLLHLLHENGKLSLDHISGIMQPFEDKESIQETMDSLALKKHSFKKAGDDYLLTSKGKHCTVHVFRSRRNSG